MKIGFSVTDNKGENSLLDSRFGRAGGFMVYDNETDIWKWIDNAQNTDSTSGAGIQAAQFMINAGINVFIGFHLGPKAFKVLNEAGIAIFQGSPGNSASLNLANHLRGLLDEINKANSDGF